MAPPRRLERPTNGLGNRPDDSSAYVSAEITYASPGDAYATDADKYAILRRPDDSLTIPAEVRPTSWAGVVAYAAAQLQAAALRSEPEAAGRWYRALAHLTGAALEDLARRFDEAHLGLADAFVVEKGRRPCRSTPGT
jgi:hypothetical protein